MLQEQFCFGELLQQARTILHCMITREFVDEPWQPKEPHGVIHPAGGVRERAGEETLADVGTRA